MTYNFLEIEVMTSLHQVFWLVHCTRTPWVPVNALQALDKFLAAGTQKLGTATVPA